MRFSLTPGPGEKGFQQWKDAISVAIRMAGGIPPSIRQKVKTMNFYSENDYWHFFKFILALDIVISKLYPRYSFRLGENMSICF